MTNQETFDFVANFLINQGEFSRFSNYCKYRYDNGIKILKCAAGCLINDDQYSEKFEGGLVRSEETWEYDINSKNLTISKIIHDNNHDCTLVAYLQNAHDSASTNNLQLNEEWILCMKNVAEQFKLSSKVLEKFDLIKVSNEI